MTSLRPPVLTSGRLAAFGAAIVTAALMIVPTQAADQRGGAGIGRQGRQARPANQPRPQQGQLNVGDMAADFTLEPRGGGEPVTLSSFRGKTPVALVFGSYT